MFVDCRIGSLESKRTYPFLLQIVDCRIGSLEIGLCICLGLMLVDCRIGSLEILHRFQQIALLVDCRIGGRIGTPAGMQEGKMKKAPLAGAFFHGLFSPLV